MIEDLTKPTRPCKQCKHHKMKTEHFCNKYNYICSIARILEEKECFEVDREDVKNKVLGFAKENFNKDIDENEPFNGLLKKDEATYFLLALEQHYTLDDKHVFELDDNELAKCLTIGDLIDLVVRSL